MESIKVMSKRMATQESDKEHLSSNCIFPRFAFKMAIYKMSFLQLQRPLAMYLKAYAKLEECKKGWV